MRYTALCGIALTIAVLHACDRDQRYAGNAVLTSAAAQRRLPGRDCACLGSGDNNDLSIHLVEQAFTLEKRLITPAVRISATHPHQSNVSSKKVAE
jgi:hypothetical protein